MAIRAEPLIRRYLDRWIYLFGLGSWRITYAIEEKPIVADGEEVMAHIEYQKKRSGYKWAHIRFHGPELKSAAAIESAVIHELLHIFDRGSGNDSHKLIYRLERPLRLVRKRLSRAT